MSREVEIYPSGTDSQYGYGFTVPWEHRLATYGWQQGVSDFYMISGEVADYLCHAQHLTDTEMSAEYWRQTSSQYGARMGADMGVFPSSMIAEEEEKMEVIEKFLNTPHFREWDSRKEKFIGSDADTDGDYPGTDVPW